MDILLDSNGDLEIDDDDLVLVDGIDAIVQDVLVRLKTVKGEWFLDTRIGIPYFNDVLGMKPRITALKGLFRTAILTTPGVIGVTDLDIEYEGGTRELAVSFTGQTTLGKFTFDKELIV